MGSMAAPEPKPPAPTSPIGAAEKIMGGGQRPFGDVWGPASPPMPDLDPREHALNALALFVSLLTFRREAGPGLPPTPFRVPLENIFVFQPDDVQNAAAPVLNSIAFLPGRGTHEPYGLGPPVELDDTADVYRPQSVLVRKGDYTEIVGVEIVEAKHQFRRAVVAGLKEAFRQGDDSGALKLRCGRAYFDRVATFRLDESEYIADDDVGLNRRRAHLYILMQVPEVQLVSAVRLQPKVSVEVTTATGSDP